MHILEGKDPLTCNICLLEVRICNLEITSIVCLITEHVIS